MNLILKNFLTDEVAPYMKEIGYRKSGGYFDGFHYFLYHKDIIILEKFKDLCEGDTGHRNIEIQ